MITAILTRGASTDNGTFGVLVASNGFKCMTVELPWLDDKPDISCKPAANYTCNLRYSEKHGCNLFHVDGGPDDGRSQIEIHAANWGGNVALGKHSDLLGCIGLGDSVAPIETPEGKIQNGVTNSGKTLKAFMAAMGTQPFALTIQWAPGQEPGTSPESPA